MRYYKEIGLLRSTRDRARGEHRLYDEGDLERLREVIRLRELLGISLDELRELVEAEGERARLRRRFNSSDDPRRRREIAAEALEHIGRQLELVRRRRRELDKLEQELCARQRRLRSRRITPGP